MRRTVVAALAAAAVVLSLGAAAPALAQGTMSEIGESVRDLRAEEVTAAKLPQPGGVVVDEIREGSPAATAGLRRGDVVVEFDGERVRSASQLTRLVRESAPGRPVKAVVVRDGARRTIDVTPAASDRLALTFPDLGPAIERGLRSLPRHFSLEMDPPQRPGDQPRRRMRGRLGLTVTPLTPQLASYFGVSRGVLVSSVEANSPAAQAGIRAGDVITAIDGRPVESAADLTRATREAAPGAASEVTVMRDRRELTLRITPADADAPLPV